MAARSIALTALVGVLLAPAANAQSLGEVARREAERRGTTAAAGTVFTNDNLKPDPTAPMPPSAPPAAGGAAARETGTAAATTGDGAKTDSAAADPDQGRVTPLELQEVQASSDKGEDFWRGRANMHKARLATKNAEIEALRQGLAAQPPGAGNQERAIANSTLSKAVADLKSFTDEWNRFQQQARERKVPDAWIR
jgi:hypothetical protein